MIGRFGLYQAVVQWKEAYFPFALPVSIFLLHAAMFGSWIVDDAGISFAYASNLARGYGLVAQPGLVPVEAYSNPLWVLILVPFFAFGMFDPIWVPKILAIATVCAGFLLYYRTAHEQLPNGRLVAVAGLSLAALQSSVVIWCISGLENGLYVALLLLLLRVMSSGQSVTAGVAAAAVAMTRPEGILFSAAYPTLLLAGRNGRTARGGIIECIRYTCGLLPPLMAFLAFRMYYFGDILPNAYYAKGGPTFRTLLDLVLLDSALIWKAGDLSAATMGARSGAWFVVLIVLAIFMFQRSIAENPLVLSVVILLSLSFLAFVLLPFDWMVEYRFATPFLLFFYLFVSHMAWFAAERLGPHKIVVFGSMVILAGMLTLPVTIPRSIAFVANPIIPMTEVMETARRFERLAQIADVTNPSLLIADVGGALLSSSLRVYDLGMLSDRTIARTLGEGSKSRNQSAFYDYVFEKTKPTFIAIRAYHSWIARLDGDDRFRRDYVAIFEYQDEWIRRRYGVSMQSGDFVRRETVSVGTDNVLSRLTAAVRGTHYVGCSVCDQGSQPQRQ